MTGWCVVHLFVFTQVLALAQLKRVIQLHDMGNCFSGPVPQDDTYKGEQFQVFIWKVHRGIYVSGKEGAKDLAAMKKLGITHVLNLVGESLYTMPEMGPIQESYYPNHFVYKHITSSDLATQDLSQFFTETTGFIQEGCARGGVLVHCWAGVSRSVSCICAYLMEKESMTFNESLNHVRIGRHGANPNEGFRKQLEFFEQTLVSKGKLQARQSLPAPLLKTNYADTEMMIYGQTPGSKPPPEVMQQQPHHNQQQEFQQQQQQQQMTYGGMPMGQMPYAPPMGQVPYGYF